MPSDMKSIEEKLDKIMCNTADISEHTCSMKYQLITLNENLSKLINAVNSIESLVKSIECLNGFDSTREIYFDS